MTCRYGIPFTARLPGPGFSRAITMPRRVSSSLIPRTTIRAARGGAPGTTALARYAGRETGHRPRPGGHRVLPDLGGRREYQPQGPPDHLRLWAGELRAAHPLIGSLDGCGYIDLGVQGVPASANVPVRPGHDTTLTVALTIPTPPSGARSGRGATGTMYPWSAATARALTKTGEGVFTLHGGHTFTGPAVVERGTLDLRGGLAGDVAVKPPGTLKGTGRIAGGLQLEGTLRVEPCGPAVHPLKIAGSARLGGKLQVCAARRFQTNGGPEMDRSGRRGWHYGALRSSYGRVQSPCHGRLQSPRNRTTGQLTRSFTGKTKEVGWAWPAKKN